MDSEVLVIEAGRGEAHYWRDLWRHRDLLVMLAWRDVSVRYKQTAIGVAWTVLRPVLTTLAFSAVFGGLAGLPSEGGAPYALLVLSGTLPWSLFASCLTEASGSLVENSSLVTKVYFPKLVIPIAAVLASTVDFLVSCLVLACFMLAYGVWPGWQVVFLPLFALLTLVAGIGPGLWLTALNVKYRDFRYVIPFVVQFGLYVSPVGFSSRIVSDEWRALYDLNPVVAVIDGFRWCILGGAAPLATAQLATGLMSSFILLVVGLTTFRRAERHFADLI